MSSIAVESSGRTSELDDDLPATANAPLLRVESLTLAYRVDGGEVTAVRDLSFEVHKGEIVALVGESGSGKTSVALAVLSYLGQAGRVVSGDVRFKDQSLVRMSPTARRGVYGRSLAHVSQDPSSSLDPSMRIGANLTEGMFAQLGLSKEEANVRALKLLAEVHLNNPEEVLRSYPHQLSGGMQQRVCIAMALACDPELVIMDEPTTGLDAATESAIFRLLTELRRSRGLSVIFISHNLPAVRSLADRVIVMYSGAAMESGPTRDVFSRPAHRYSAMLLESLPTMRSSKRPTEIPWQAASTLPTGCAFRERCDMAVARCASEVAVTAVAPHRLSACVRAADLLLAHRLRDSVADVPGVVPPGTSSPQTVQLDVAAVSHVYRRSIWAAPSKERRSLDNVSFRVPAGEVVALIGESGSGKSTLARCIVGLESPLEGSLRFEGHDLARRGRRPLQIVRRLQIVFQNIAGSLHPRKAVSQILARPYLLYESRKPHPDELSKLMQSVGLKPAFLSKRPPTLSGGERQRVALARSSCTSPSLIVLDEAFSALDVSMKVRVMGWLEEQRRTMRLSILLITHDLPIVRFLADRVAVLYRGWLCEEGPRRIIEAPPMHPYTEMLAWSALQLEGLSPATLDLQRAGIPIRTDAALPKKGCPFQSRCPRKLGVLCETTEPPMQEVGVDHRIACHIPILRLRQIQAAEWSSASPLVAQEALDGA